MEVLAGHDIHFQYYTSEYQLVRIILLGAFFGTAAKFFFGDANEKRRIYWFVARVAALMLVQQVDPLLTKVFHFQYYTRIHILVRLGLVGVLLGGPALHFLTWLERRYTTTSPAK